MLVELTHAEMLGLWRRRAGLEPLRADCRVETVEGVDADAAIEPRMRGWYLHLLDTADAALLPREDVAAETALDKCEEHGAAAGELPVRARRLLEVRLTGWKCPAEPCGEAEWRRRRALWRNPYCAPGPATPVCAVQGRRVHVAPCEDGDVAVEVHAVVDPGAGKYVLDEALLDTIPDIFEETKL